MEAYSFVVVVLIGLPRGCPTFSAVAQCDRCQRLRQNIKEFKVKFFRFTVELLVLEATANIF